MSTKETEILDFRFLGGFYILPWSQVVRQAGLFNLNRTDNTAVCETVFGCGSQSKQPQLQGNVAL